MAWSHKVSREPVGSMYVVNVPCPISGPLYWHGLTLILTWMSNHIYSNVRGGIIYPFPNANGAAVKVWEWIRDFIPCFNGHVITYPCWDYCWTMLVNGPPVWGRPPVASLNSPAVGSRLLTELLRAVCLEPHTTVRADYLSDYLYSIRDSTAYKRHRA